MKLKIFIFSIISSILTFSSCNSDKRGSISEIISGELSISNQNYKQCLKDLSEEQNKINDYKGKDIYLVVYPWFRSVFNTKDKMDNNKFQILVYDKVEKEESYLEHLLAPISYPNSNSDIIIQSHDFPENSFDTLQVCTASYVNPFDWYEKTEEYTYSSPNLSFDEKMDELAKHRKSKVKNCYMFYDKKKDEIISYSDYLPGMFLDKINNRNQWDDLLATYIYLLNSPTTTKEDISDFINKSKSLLDRSGDIPNSNTTNSDIFFEKLKNGDFYYNENKEKYRDGLPPTFVLKQTLIKANVEKATFNRSNSDLFLTLKNTNFVKTEWIVNPNIFFNKQLVWKDISLFSISNKNKENTKEETEKIIEENTNDEVTEESNQNREEIIPTQED